VALEGVRGQHRAPATLYPRERPGTHCTGGWSGQVRKIPPPGFDPRTVQPVASRCPDYAARPTDGRISVFQNVSLLRCLFCSKFAIYLLNHF
jgi:hypothetical protein